MSASPFFPLPDGLEITDVRETTDGVIVCVTSQRESSPCPLCSLSSSAIHSFYRRHPQDLPCVGRPIRLILTDRSVLLSKPQLSSQSVHRAHPRFHFRLFSPHRALAHRGARDRFRDQWQRRRAPRWQAWNACFRCHSALVSLVSLLCLRLGSCMW